MGTSVAGEATRPKRGLEERPLSLVVRASWGSFGQRLEQLLPRSARVSSTGKSVLSSLESNDSVAYYLEAFKTSLGDISQGEWNTLEGLADEDSMGAATRATDGKASFWSLCLYFYLILGLIRNFLSSWQATLYLLKSLNINVTKVSSYDKLKADFDEAISEKTCLEGQLHQAIEDRDCCKSEKNLSRGEKAKLEERITGLLSRITELEVEVASLKSQLEAEHQ